MLTLRRTPALLLLGSIAAVSPYISSLETGAPLTLSTEPWPAALASAPCLDVSFNPDRNEYGVIYRGRNSTESDLTPCFLRLDPYTLGPIADPIPLHGPAANVGAVAIVHADGMNRYLAAFGAAGDPPGVYVRVLDDQGQGVGPTSYREATFNFEVAFNGEVFGLARERGADFGDAHVIALDTFLPEGNLVASNVEVSESGFDGRYPAISNVGDSPGQFMIAWAGRKAEAFGTEVFGLEAFGEEFTIRVRAVAPSVADGVSAAGLGTFELDPWFDGRNGSWPRMAWSRDHRELLVVWAATSSPERDIVALRIGMDGQPLGSEFFIIQRDTKGEFPPAVSWDAGRGEYLIAWQEGALYGGATIRAARLRGGSDEILETNVPISQAGGSYAPCLAVGQGENLALWEVGDADTASLQVARMGQQAPLLDQLGQWTPDGGDAIDEGDEIGTSLLLRARVSHPYATVEMELALEPGPFEPVGTATPAAGTGSWGPTGGWIKISVSGLPRGAACRWRTRAVVPGAPPAPWIDFGTGATDFTTLPNTLVIPSMVGQSDADNATAVAPGQRAFGDGIRIGATWSDPEADPQRLEVEVLPAGAEFRGMATAISDFSAAGSADLFVPLPPGSYHWQWRLIDVLDLATPWKSFGSNAETDADFSLVTYGSGGSTSVCASAGAGAGMGLLLCAAFIVGILRRVRTSAARVTLSAAVLATVAGFSSTIPGGIEVRPHSYVKAFTAGADQNFGAGVSVSGDTLVVGAPREEGTIGAAYVFRWKEGEGWLPEARLQASNAGAGDLFGGSVAIDGDTIIIGARGEDGGGGNPADNSASDSGAAYVFVRTATVWNQQAYLKATRAGVQDQFGISVAIDGDTVVVGAHTEDGASTIVDGDASELTAPEAGAAYAFTRSGTLWSPPTYLKAPTAAQNSWFGRSVAVDGDTIVVGTPREHTLKGRVHVFLRSGAGWTQGPELKASNADYHSHFGFSVAIDGDTIAVGAHQEDTAFQDSGAVYLFVRGDAGWEQRAWFKAFNADVDDTFGVSVAVSGDLMVVGSSLEDSAAMGIDGDASDNSAVEAGAAYLFVRTEGVWAASSYLKASNTGADDRFGSCVAIDGTLIVVGAPREDSAGDMADNSAADAGAVYVFAPLPPDPPESLQQRSLDGGTVINPGGISHDLGFSVRALVNHPEQKPVRLELQVRPAGSSFSPGLVTSTGDLTPSGSVAAVTVTGLELATAYHWQARAVAENGLSSSWICYGAHPDDEEEVDLVTRSNSAPTVISIDQRIPSPGGLLPLATGAQVLSRQVAFEISAVDADEAGDPALLEVEVLPVGADFLGIPTISSPMASSHSPIIVLADLSTGAYHWRFRLRDFLGGSTGWTAFGGNPESAADFSLKAFGSAGSGCGSHAGAGATFWMAVMSIALACRRR